MLKKFFKKLHDVDFPYVVMRNWDNLPEMPVVDGHGDLDLLVYDKNHFLELFPEFKPVYPAPRVFHKALIEDRTVYADLRSVGDGYYPTHFQRAMLESREKNPKGFYTPNQVHHQIGLAYHVVHHKNENKYQRWLGSATIEQLLGALKESNIGYCLPSDHSVGRFNQYFKGATATVTKDGESFVKKQTSYGDYALIQNEARILKKCNSCHFPKLLEAEGDSIRIEDCGERLNVHNLPGDWKHQLVRIAMCLDEAGVEHRDIKPDNLMVKDGIIKLIDFGWARFKDDLPDDPPSCLGYPYRPSWGFDDKFSIKKIIKEMDYKCESLALNVT